MLIDEAVVGTEVWVVLVRNQGRQAPLVRVRAGRVTNVNRAYPYYAAGVAISVRVSGNATPIAYRPEVVHATEAAALAARRALLRELIGQLERQLAEEGGS